jgi:hypothetical protein
MKIKKHLFPIYYGIALVLFGLYDWLTGRYQWSHLVVYISAFIAAVIFFYFKEWLKHQGQCSVKMTYI